MNDARQIEQTVTELVAKQGGAPTTDVTRATHFVDDLNFDSLDLVELTMSLEEAFRLTIPDGQAEALRTVGDVVDYVLDKTRSAAAGS